MITNLIVGSGLSGATLARKLADDNQKVIIIDKREHIGGNVYDYIDKQTNIRLSKYGAHIFHTNDEEVWKFVNHYSEWLDYEHKVLSYVDNKFVPVPVNITTVNKLFNLNIQDEPTMVKWLSQQQIKSEINNSKDAALARVGKDLYKLMFENYTLKQWALKPEQLEPSVLERIPVRTNFNDRYFNDKYEALPAKGYTEFVNNLLNHKNISIYLNEPYKAKKYKTDRVFFTGKIDSYFNEVYGKLQYRSLNFNYETLNIENYQTRPVVNYPSLKYAYTRIIDYKQFYNTKSPYSIIAKEYSTDKGEEYYPIPTLENRTLYSKYQKLAKNLESNNIFFVGRLAEYKYYNMDQAIKSAIILYNKLQA